jgi:hypothetical protein
MSLMSELKEMAGRYNNQAKSTPELLDFMTGFLNDRGKSLDEKTKKDYSSLLLIKEHLSEPSQEHLKGQGVNFVGGGNAGDKTPPAKEPTGKTGIIVDKQQQEDAEATETGGDTRKRQEDAAKKKKKIQDDLDKWSK